MDTLVEVEAETLGEMLTENDVDTLGETLCDVEAETLAEMLVEGEVDALDETLGDILVEIDAVTRLETL